MVCNIVVHTSPQTKFDLACRHIIHFWVRSLPCIHALICSCMHACMHVTQVTDASPYLTLCRLEGCTGLLVRPVAASSRTGFPALAMILSKHASSELKKVQTRVNDAAWQCVINCQVLAVQHSWRPRFFYSLCVIAHFSIMYSDDFAVLHMKGRCCVDLLKVTVSTPTGSSMLYPWHFEGYCGALVGEYH